MLNRLIELSVLPQEKGSLFAVVPVRSFRANGNEIKTLSITASVKGLVSLHDVSGGMIANATVNDTLGSESVGADKLPAYEPELIIKPPNVNELVFGVLSKNRLDAFRLVVDDPKTKKNRLVHLWVSTLEEAGVKGKAVHIFSSR